jgi:RNA polymerase sigma-70 factor, ECF subfamily
VSISNNNDNLIRRLQAGDNDAFVIIYHTFSGRLHRFANEYLNDSDTSNDVIQNVFTKLWQNRILLNDDTNIAAWLYTVAKNEALSLLEHRMIVYQHRQIEQERLSAVNCQALREVGMSDESYSDIIDILQATLKKLSPQCRIVFECSRYRLMSNRDISDYLSISVKTVESHMTRALRTLRIALSDYI